MSYKKVRIYVEGGGDNAALQVPLRKGFIDFLKELTEKVSLSVIPCGGRGQTFEKFRNAVVSYPDNLCLLLLDAEEPTMANSPQVHLKRQNPSWIFPSNASDDQYHLMVEIMESWFLADKEYLAKYHGAGFKADKIPKRKDVESVPKAQVYKELSAATKESKKGEYKQELKRTRGPEILGYLRAEVVQSKAPHCKRLFETINQKIQSGEIAQKPTIR